MKFIKQDLLTLLIGLFLFASCKSSNSIGIVPDPSLAIKGELDTILVQSRTVAEEAKSSLGFPRHPLGYISGDADFGTTEASLAMSVTLPGGTYRFGENPTVDSAVLVLPYSTQFYGDTATSVYSFNVHQLENDISQEKSFLSNKVWPVLPNVVGTFTGKVLPKTPVKITDIVTGKPDTVVTIPPHIRIKLSNAFIQSNLLNLDSATLSKNGKFTAAFKGLHVSVNKANSTGKGGIMFFDFTGANANVQVYYKRPKVNSTSEIDTVAVSFPIASTTGPVAATVKHDYAGTPVMAQLSGSTPSTPYNVTYLQALSGVRNKISFPSLSKFIERAKGGNAQAKIVINRAELIVNLTNGTDVAPFTAAPRLALYRLDIAGQRANIPDNDAPTQTSGNPYKYAGSELAFGGFYEPTNKRYVFTVTSYLQDLIDGTTQDYGTYLAASSLTEFNLSPAVSSAARSIINTSFPAAGNKGMELKIYYTKVD
jgi:hypothetical protein